MRFRTKDNADDSGAHDERIGNMQRVFKAGRLELGSIGLSDRGSSSSVIDSESD